MMRRLPASPSAGRGRLIQVSLADNCSNAVLLLCLPECTYAGAQLCGTDSPALIGLIELLQMRRGGMRSYVTSCQNDDCDREQSSVPPRCELQGACFWLALHTATEQIGDTTLLARWQCVVHDHAGRLPHRKSAGTASAAMAALPLLWRMQLQSRIQRSSMTITAVSCAKHASCAARSDTHISICRRHPHSISPHWLSFRVLLLT